MFGPIQSSLSLEIRSTPPDTVTNQDSVHLAHSQNYAVVYMFVFYFISGVGSKLSQIKWNSGKGIPTDFMTDLCSVNLEWMKLLMRI